jgi:zinc protease
MPDRSVPPKIANNFKLQLPEVQIQHLDNGIPLYLIQRGTQEVAKLEIVFNAGRPYEEDRLAARATSSLLKEGSRQYPRAEIAEQLDFLGCTLSTPFNLDTSNITLYSLNKQLEKSLPILEDILRAPTFSQEALDNYQQRNIHKLAVDLTQNDVVAYREITALIFGQQHAYGYNSSPEMYQQLKQEHLKKHFSRLYNQQNCTIFISGKISSRTLASIRERLNDAILPGARAVPKLPATDRPGGSTYIALPNMHQSSIRIGRKLFNRHHPDYKGLFVLNNILGGYFGSRLMTNLREDKGYTYNIYSSLDAMRYDGYFYIGTETGTSHTTATLEQIYLEMQKLQDNPISAKELEMVRNYLMGNFLTMLDGPFNVAEVVKTLISDLLPLSFFESLVQTVQEIQAEELQLLAQKYFNRQDMWEVIVGP